MLADLSMESGMLVSYGEDPRDEYSGMLFDVRCRRCARFVKMPKVMHFRLDIHGSPDRFQPVYCTRCGEVEPVFWGFGA
jgi:hypothetical protein